MNPVQEFAVHFISMIVLCVGALYCIYQLILLDNKEKKMTLVKKDQYIEVTLKATSLNIVNIPIEILKEIGWDINETVEVCITDCLNHINEEWKEIQIIRKVDANIIYKEEQQDD